MKFKSAVLLFVLIICLIGYSCNGGGDNNISASTEETTDAIHPWNDLPVYPNAEFIRQRETEQPPGYQSSIMRLYETTVNPQVINSYYKARMPFLDWKSFGGDYVEGEYQSTWGKNNNDILVWITIRPAPAEGKTLIELIRAEK